ncbi:MAG: gluconeogenesis factor YvcK family protein [Culicoidibacterales bacterium]
MEYKQKKIVALGGGTGLSALLRGLKYFPVDLTAVVTIADDGGSSGLLRKTFEMPPPGDIRNVITAMSEVEPLVQELFQYRFKTDDDLKGHPVGNLLLAAMNDITNDFPSAVSALCQVLNVRGQVLPSTIEAPRLHAALVDGTMITGEQFIGKAPKPIDYVFLDKKHSASKHVIRAIKEADAIILGPGSLYTSVIPNLLVENIRKAFIESDAKKIYISNIMMEAEETRNYSVSDHVKAIEKHLQKTGIIDTVFVNDAPIPKSLLEGYKRIDNIGESKVDYEVLEEMGIEIIASRLVEDNVHYVRHDSLKLASMIFTHVIG